MVHSIFVPSLNGFQYLLAVSIMIVLNFGMIAGFFREMSDIDVR